LLKSNDFSIILSLICTNTSPINITKSINIELNPKFYGNYSDFEKRIKETPSLKECEELIVNGDITFKENVIISKKVEINSDKTGEATLSNISINNRNINL
jgi:acetyltransferase-like isoleucine patch superfamily enzyme